MDGKIPIPTDNIYKFLATFGLAIVISSMTLLLISVTSTNKIIWTNASAVYDLESGKDPRKDDKIKLLKKEIEISISNRVFSKWALSAIFIVGALASFEGFRKWAKDIQPIHDAILLMQKEKLALEVAALNQTMRPKIQENSPT